MPSIPITSPFGFLGVFLLLAGFFILLAGLGIIQIEKISVTKGTKTWAMGIFAVGLGIAFLALDIINSSNQIRTPTPTPTSLANTATPSRSPSPTQTATLSPTPSLTSTPAASPTHTTSPTARAMWPMNISDGDRAAQTITLIGEYPANTTDDLWVFVVPTSNKLYYPQSSDACKGERTPKLNGYWELRIGLGGPGSVDEEFQVVLMTADARASQSIADTLVAWCQAGSFPGLKKDELPQGISEKRAVTVRRTPDEWGPAPAIIGIDLQGQLSIANVADGGGVFQTQDIAGTYTPDTMSDIWVLVYAPNGRWYPQSKDACKGIHVEQAGGQWQAQVGFGGPSNVGQPFDIMVVLANPKASAFFSDNQRKWCEAQNYPGYLTIELPEGISDKARIRVYRR